MATRKRNEDTKAVLVEFSVSMHCNACERVIAKTISKFKGVETFTTDMTRHRVSVKGHINPQKLLKKLKKKTGKKVEIIEEEEEEKSDDKSNYNELGLVSRWPPLLGLGNYCKECDQFLMLFNDENPNACPIM